MMLLRLGPHSLVTEISLMTGPPRSPVSYLATAADLALSGIPVFVRRSLVRTPGTKTMA